jgi:hypothetical protein
VTVPVAQQHLVGVVLQQREDAHAVAGPVVLQGPLRVQVGQAAQVLQAEPAHHPVAQAHAGLHPGGRGAHGLEELAQCAQARLGGGNGPGIGEIGPGQGRQDAAARRR